jgi:hypothetical protein
MTGVYANLPLREFEAINGTLEGLSLHSATQGRREALNETRYGQ